MSLKYTKLQKNYDIYKSCFNIPSIPHNIYFVVFRKIAKKVDINNDGMLSEEELKKWILENHMKYLLRNAIEYIADVDTNNDSKMSFKEYEDSHFIPGKS